MRATMLVSPLIAPFSPLAALLRSKFLDNASSGSKSVLILYGSQSGVSKEFCESLACQLKAFSGTHLHHCLNVYLSSIGEYNFHGPSVDFNSAIHTAKSLPEVSSSIARFETVISFDVVVICMSTWTNGAPPPNSADFVEFLEDLVSDFRVDRHYFSNVKGFCVVGFGNAEYDRFCTPAISIYHKIKKLGGNFLLPLLKVNDGEDTQKVLRDWTSQLFETLPRVLLHDKSQQLTSCSSNNCTSQCLNSSSCVCADPSTCSCHVEAADEDEADNLSSCSFSTSSDDTLLGQDTAGCGSENEDVEDVGHAAALDSSTEKPHMLTTRQRQQLVKEGYKIVGSHSAVKLCRWTKSQLRGRGGCYKHTFYGIESYLCMEATPSLACANKCVFCWRHHKNPVGKSWKWNTDDPSSILEGITKEHRTMVKQLKGVSGVSAERFQEATQRIRHCALSLVGEPIMYPKIAELLTRMHDQEISTFLVTNAQFPQEMRSLPPVTQLYVSVDAACRETLKKIDRPLFFDFWERFLESLSIVRTIAQRTVFRLTLVKKYNMQEAVRFGELIVDGQPDFIEIKAVTYCGTSPGTSDITMTDIPWHDEVVSYASAILASNTELSSRYAIACEHQHSCCVLVAHKKFLKDGVWHTWINYPRFFELVRSGEPFSALDYSAATPSWATYGSEARGFDPLEQRYCAKKRVSNAELFTVF